MGGYIREEGAGLKGYLSGVVDGGNCVRKGGRGDVLLDVIKISLLNWNPSAPWPRIIFV